MNNTLDGIWIYLTVFSFVMGLLFFNNPNPETIKTHNRIQIERTIDNILSFNITESITDSITDSLLKKIQFKL